MYFNAGLFEKCIAFATKNFRIIQAYSGKSGVINANGFNLIGLCWGQLKQYDKGAEYARKAIEILKNSPLKKEGSYFAAKMNLGMNLKFQSCKLSLINPNSSEAASIMAEASSVFRSVLKEINNLRVVS